MYPYESRQPELRAHWLQLLQNAYAEKYRKKFVKELIRIFSGEAVLDLQDFDPDDLMTEEELKLLDQEIEADQQRMAYLEDKFRNDELTEMEQYEYEENLMFSQESGGLLINIEMAESAVFFTKDILALIIEFTEHVCKLEAQSEEDKASLQSTWYRYLSQLFLCVQREQMVRIAFTFRIEKHFGKEFTEAMSFPSTLLSSTFQVNSVSDFSAIYSVLRKG